MFSPRVENLVAQLTRLPGVGSRTAHRFAFHLLRVSKDEALALAAAIEEVKERVRFCNECGNLTEDEMCAICLDARRDHSLNGVVEVVLATNPNMTGEATAHFLADRLRGRVRVTRLASGLPVGGDLEYADEVTLGRALSGRREM
jgi:recombination protein RecR